MTRTEIGVATPPADPWPDAQGDRGSGRHPIPSHHRTPLTGFDARTRSPSRPLHHALALLSLAALLCGSVELAFAVHRGIWYYAAMVVGAWVYVAAGALAWSRRPSNGLGCLMIVGGFLLLIANLDVTGLRVLTAGQARQ